MFKFDEPIKSIQQAKEYFNAMGCSGFHMYREFPQRYEEYKKLNISNEMEIEWIAEQFDEYYTSVMVDKNAIPLWNIHSRMDKLVETLRTNEALRKMLEVTQHIQDRVPFDDRVIVSETINGRRDRRYRSGLIYLAYDLNNIPVAKVFAELSMFFAIYEEGKNKDFGRCQRATMLCNDIKVELGL